jgi:two-component system sensor histidine kinase DegS
MTGPYTREHMDATRTGTEPREAGFDAPTTEARAVLEAAIEALRAIRDRADEDEAARTDGLGDATGPGDAAGPDGSVGLAPSRPLLEFALRSLQNARLFLDRGDAALSDIGAAAALPPDVQMRIVEAQEGERSRLAQEIHDGPAQALSNAIFQVEYIERVVDQDPRLAHAELRFLRELLRRELGDVRSYISQLRPPRLLELGLDGAIAESAENLTALTGVAVETDLAAPPDLLDEASQTVALRIVQEALQNVRKHASATRVRVTTRLEGDDWLLEVRDDGRGFDPETVGTRGRRNFGLQFMRERAELIGAHFGVRSRPDGGTIVTLGIPIGGERG